MITKFSFDKRFFDSRALHDDSISAVHDFITSSWVDYGVVVLPDGGAEQLLELIAKLPAKFRQRWAEAFEYGKRIEVGGDWWDFGAYNNFEAMCELNGLFKTALSDDEISYILCDFTSYSKCCEKTGFEMLGAGVSSESIHLQNSKNSSISDISSNETPELVWDSKFKSLALYSKRITIIDRYFYEQVQRAAQNNSVDESLNNFFTFLAKLKKEFNVKIISYGSEKNSALHTAVYDAFYRSVYKVPALKKALKTLTLVSADETFFKKEAHDRLIGFDKHICQVGNGMRVLGGLPIPSSTFHAKFDRKGELSRRENESRKHQLWYETF